MLSTDTTNFLEMLLRRSKEAYQEGGLLYTFIEAANQAHTRFPQGSTSTPNSQPTAIESNNLALCIYASQGNPGSKEPDSSAVVCARELLQRLQRDLGFDRICCIFDDQGDSMGITIAMARYSDNRYFSLKLWWSID